MITGAARGIGKAIALKLASEGANIAFCDIVIDENGETLYGEAYSIRDGRMEQICRDGESVRLS